MRFLHTADWQLGMTRHFLNGDAQPRYSAARRDVVASLGALAAETGAEFVVVAGDVFEDNQLAPRVISQSLEAMRAINIPVFLLPGNHDPLDAGSIYTSPLFTAERPSNVTVLDRSGVFDIRSGVQILAVPWRSKAPTSDLVADALADVAPDGVTRIVVAHGGVDALDPDRHDPAVIRLEPVHAALADGRAHYVALGDKHSRTCVGNSGRVWYSGAPEVTNFDDVEADPGHVLVVDIDEDAPERPVTVNARRVGQWKFVTLRRPVDTGRDVADLDINLDQLQAKERTVVRLALTGSLSVTDRAALDACLDRYARLFASLRIWERQSDIAVVPADEEFTNLGVGGFVAAAVDELVSVARSADSVAAGDAQAALGLLLRLAGQGSAA